MRSVFGSLSLPSGASLAKIEAENWSHSLVLYWYVLQRNVAIQAKSVTDVSYFDHLMVEKRRWLARYLLFVTKQTHLALPVADHHRDAAWIRGLL